MPKQAAPSATLTPLEEAVQTRAYHLDQADLHQQEAAKATARIREILGEPQKGVKAGNHTVSWTPPNRQFDEPRFVEMYPPDKNPNLYKQVLDKSQIPPSLKDQFMKLGNGDGTVTIK